MSRSTSLMALPDRISPNGGCCGRPILGPLDRAPAGNESSVMKVSRWADSMANVSFIGRQQACRLRERIGLLLAALLACQVRRVRLRRIGPTSHVPQVPA